MSELREWLRRHNLEQYADAFEANDIGIDILPELSERDLEQLGLSLGNRRRLLKAVAGRAAEAASPQQELPAQAASDAERRQVTVLFCDMVGSTALSNAIDPELLGGVIRRYQDAAAGAIGRFGGFVAKFMGDGVLAYFGFPRAFEDAAERAVRAAINSSPKSAASSCPDGSRARARIGIATGLVVVGEIVGFGTAQERTIVGDTPNLAARLQALAAPDTILISEATQSLLGGLFHLEFTGRTNSKDLRTRCPLGACSAKRRSRAASPRSAPDAAARRPGARNGADARALASRPLGRGSDRHRGRRGWYRQIARDRGVAGRCRP